MSGKQNKLVPPGRTARVSHSEEPSTRFYRSTNLDRDFYADDALANYCLTDSLRGYVARVVDGLRQGSALRAWRIIGPYGCGKSSFALALARHLSGKTLPKSLIALPKFDMALTPILVTCTKAPLAQAVIKGVENFSASRPGRPIKALRRTDCTPSEQAIDCLKSLFDRGEGVLLILDELGKALEYAALNPTDDDVYLLQQMAEMAARNQDKPFVLITLLHQNVGAYADRLGIATIREWEKVAGRFEEIQFEQPFTESLSIIAHMLNVDTAKISAESVRIIDQAANALLNEGWVSGKIAPNTLKKSFAELHPLHPFFVPVLFKFMQRFVQNDRSVYGFLFANEPFGLRAFSEQGLLTSFYTLSDFYDYIRANQIHRMERASVLTRWAYIQSMVDRVCDSDIESKLLKCVAVLNLVDDQTMRPTGKALEWCLPGISPNELHSAIARLKKAGTLFTLGRAGGYCLWPNTSVNLDEAMKSAEADIKTARVSSLIEKYLPNRPILARRHYIETGNLRWFEVDYCSSDMLNTKLEAGCDSGDGRIIFVLCENPDEVEHTKRILANGTLTTGDNVLVGVTRSLAELSQHIDAVRRWEWIEKHTDGLANDEVARTVVMQQLEASKAELAHSLETHIGLCSVNGDALSWYRQGIKIEVSSIQSAVSGVCDDLFCEAPIFKHEVLNRQSLSSAGAAAQMRLIEAMFAAEDKPFFGMDETKRPPEMSMYLAFFKNGCVHSDRGGFWQVCLPSAGDDGLRLRPVFLAVEQYLRDRADQRVPVLELVKVLAAAPFGVRAGLAYLIITIVLLVHQHDIAVYNNGSFVSEIHKETLAGIVKAARIYEVQYCKIEGVRREVFKRIAHNCGFVDPNKTELLDVVAALCRFKAGLPEYSLKTRQIGMVAQAVRSVISEAREPINFVFRDLPTACGHAAFKPGEKIPEAVLNAFVGTLSDAVEELRYAYDELKNRMKVKIAKACGLGGDFQENRVSLANRAIPFIESVAEIRIKGFAMRLMMDNLPESEWLESMGDFVVQKTPQKWNDVDEGVFEQEMANLAGRFIRTEAIGFKKRGSQERAYRLFITEQSGHERGQVMFLDQKQRAKLVAFKRQLESTLSTVDLETQLAAVSEWLWDILPNEGDKQ